MNFSLDTILIGAIAVLFIIAVVVILRLWKVERRLRTFFSGKDAKSLEDVFVLLRREMMEARRTLQDVDARIREARERLRGSVQNVGMVRFNPFRDAGGDQSFCIALLDEKQNGVVISSLYARDGVRVYGKPIQAGASTYTLSEEERQAISKALQEN
ncbi:MAG: hypothetical protein A3H64_01205 [Candidatus Ryanbacteria bacterium RIFCSPLOWO2_02_FULL_45_11c]|uniref:DUF4446 domain-containing protein n=1 Tax=Candidatus Ryanbacteria bacterium RIFCSPLOWO2_02_FULL_45_11c TaxID=1802128 RepID=A0A1G2H2L1_9BACT|nr:MAG: hypothetical protein A3H64_01205 [Candidatus Ryanbacteria bacterium RIFCSPLOWO2_02_FULL_45_11c]